MRQQLGRRATCIVGIAAVLLGCDGGGDDGSGRDPVGAGGLPTRQGALAGELCLTRAELRDPTARTDRRRARRELERLVTMYRRDPDAVVVTTYLPSAGGTSRESLTLRQLVGTHVEGVPEVIETGDAGARACARRLRARLQGLE